MSKKNKRRDAIKKATQKQAQAQALQKKRDATIKAGDLTPSKFIDASMFKNLTRVKTRKKLTYYKIARDYFINASAPLVANTKTRVNNTNITVKNNIRATLYNKNLTREQKRDAVKYFTRARRQLLDIDGAQIDGVYFKNNAKKLNYIKNNLTRDAKKQYTRELSGDAYKQRAKKRKSIILDKLLTGYYISK